MTDPILPLTLTWGNTEQEKADVAKTKYGEAGVEQRDFIGINPISTSWDINVNIRNFQEVDDFLRSRRGQPFRLSLDGGVSDDGKFYICTEWQIQQLGVSAGNFSAKITQVRRFIYIPEPEPEPDIINPVFLLSGNGANNANNFRDFYGRALNPSGNPIYSTAQSKWNNSALYFDGNSYIQSPLVFELTFGSGDLTWEAWVYVTQAVFDTGYQAIFGNTFGTGSGNAGLFLALAHNYNNYKFVFRHWVDGYSNAASTQTINLNTWYHVACTKSGTVLEIFVNGIKGTSGSTSLFNTDYAFNLGRASNPGGYAANFRGYLDDIRLTKGVVRYTSNFTPPTQEFSKPIDPYQNNNVLLFDFRPVNGNNFFYDYCGNSCTGFGNAQLSSTQSKFDGTSLYLDGNGDYVQIPHNNNFHLPGDFTIEAWIYKQSENRPRTIISKTSVSAIEFALVLENTEKISFFNQNSSIFIISTNTVPNNTWSHIAVTRKGSNIRLFINGNLEATQVSSAWLYYAQSPVFIGALDPYNSGFSNFFNGYIDDLRITKGIARYTANFTPDNYPAILERDLDIDKVVFLAHFNGANNSTTIADLTNKAITKNGSPTISTTQSKWNGSSLYLNGTSSALLISQSQLDLRSSINPVWTVECWIYQLSQTGRRVIFGNYNIVNSGQANALLLATTQIGTDNTFLNYTLPQNQWIHWCVTRNSNGIISLYLNGLLNNSILANPSNSSNNNFIGGSPGDNNIGNEWLNAYINDFRITLDVRYTSNFTPRTRPFPDIN
ncbi:hypothetical protein NIES592_08275 [Fischerella major NIES-592]|uniref:LamG-like jellyroll fold domain-containing protein n=1 Tax=Fischerella major NIES-592 TaxID=210994 RepID=A0A1U7H1K7_9CYAN|nr:hypothetical protein NIES592_08275 [Fischerella major NIES-592]